MTPARKTPRAELHTHLGSSVDPVIMWTIAHEQGIKLPAKEYWEFENMITMTADEKNADLDEMTDKFFHWTQLIQSSPMAIEVSTHSVIGGGYRKCNLVIQELKINPMRRNRGGERDLDHIILAALWGVRRAMLEYPQVKAGIIFEMDRTFTPEQNEVILEKAIKYKNEGVVGIDISGPDRDEFSIEAHLPHIEKARSAGLGITIHAGETGDVEELLYVINTVKPDRIGHGIAAAKSDEAMKAIVHADITLEICPTSNLKNSMVKDVDELRTILQTFIKNGVKFTINTDGPEMYCTNMVKEEEFLMNEKILNEEEIVECRKNAFAATFVK